MAPVAKNHAESIRAQDPDFFSYNETSHWKGSMMGEVGFSFQATKSTVGFFEQMERELTSGPLRSLKQISKGKLPFDPVLIYGFAGAIRCTELWVRSVGLLGD